MSTCLLTLGILLAGQVGGSEEPRYPSVISPPAATTPSATGPSETGPSATSKSGVGMQPATNPRRPASQPIRPNPQRATLSPPTNSSPQTNSAPPAAGLSKVTKPADLFQTLVKPATNEQLAGAPLSLADAVQEIDSRKQQTLRVRRYWELSQLVADYRLSALEALELRSLRSGIAQPSPAWEEAQQAVAARQEVARNALRAAQLRLQKEMSRAADAALPLPTDMPLCGAYDTRFENIFKGRTSLEAEQLSQLLPLRFEELGQAANDTTAAHAWLVAASKARSPRDDGRQLLKAYEQLALQRRAFIDTAYQYNEEIARYTELAVPQQVAPVRLVAMLIDTEGSFAGDWQRGGIRRANAEQPNRPGTAERYQPRTFAEQGRKEVRRFSPKKSGAEAEAERTADTERSILVPEKKNKLGK